MVIYIVQPGDTVSSIARDTGTAAELIMYINQITYPYLLAVGQALLLPEASDLQQIGTPEVIEDQQTGSRRAAVMNGYAYPFINEMVLNETLPYLTALYVFSYGFTSSGELIPPEIDDSRMIRSAFRTGNAPDFNADSVQ